MVVAAGDEFRRRPNDRRAEEVEGAVDEGGEDGEGAGENYDGDFAREQDRIGDQVDVDRDCHGAATAFFAAAVGVFEFECLWSAGGGVAKERGGFVGDFVEGLGGPFDFDLRAVTVLGGFVDYAHGWVRWVVGFSQIGGRWLLL